MKFFQITVTEIEGTPNEILAKVYRQNNMERAACFAESGGLTMEERLKNGECTECGNTEWDVKPFAYNDYMNGGNGKPNIECRNCGHITHL
jgi:hypothetical protein